MTTATYAWSPVESFRIPGSGSRLYTLIADSPCRVVGQRGVWRVVSAEQHNVDGRVNVQVIHATTARTRIFPATSLVYVRPSSAAGRKAGTNR